MSYPPDHKCKPRIRLTPSGWYAFAPNNSPMAMALLVKAINFVRTRNQKEKKK